MFIYVLGGAFLVVLGVLLERYALVPSHFVAPTNIKIEYLGLPDLRKYQISYDRGKKHYVYQGIDSVWYSYPSGARPGTGHEIWLGELITAHKMKQGKRHDQEP